nr:MAG TPA: hypothetical protein [Caudoviricetes sp.]
MLFIYLNNYNTIGIKSQIFDLFFSSKALYLCLIFYIYYINLLWKSQHFEFLLPSKRQLSP